MMVDMNEILKIAKEVITEEIEKEGLRVLNFFIFGSRARGDFKPDSDWDFLVVIDKEINRDTKWDIILKIKRKLAKLKIPNDIIINTKRQIQERKNNVGYITYYALKEGTQT